MNKNLLDEAVNAILNARNLCGNEEEALIIIEEDYNISFSKKEKKEIKRQVNKLWNKQAKV